MRSVLADLFRILFKMPFFRKWFFGIHQRIIYPLNLFQGVTKSWQLNNSINFDLTIEDWIQENLFFLGEYEALELRYLQKFLEKDAVFIDIGANIGLYTLYASTLVGENGKVIAFEPFRDNFNSLQHNVSLNDNKNIILEKLALSSKREQMTIAYDKKEANKGMASSYATSFSHSEMVDAISLDMYLKSHPIDRIDFIKIDIEGGEYPALLGMQETLERYHPVLLIEIKEEILSQTPYSEKQIIELLNHYGYVKYNGPEAQTPGEKVQENFLFIKSNQE